MNVSQYEPLSDATDEVCGTPPLLDAVIFESYEGPFDWSPLVESQASISADMTLEEVQNFFRHHPHEEYAVVLDGDFIIGLCSEWHISRILSMRGGMGFALYSKRLVYQYVDSRPLVIRQGAAARDVLAAVMRRDKSFFDDAILIDENDRFAGLIPSQLLMQLQHAINEKYLLELSGLNHALQESNLQIEAARDAAMQAAEMKSAFLANMSHEIRTPLNGVLGMLKVLMRTSLAEQQRSHVRTISNSAQSLLAILNDILDFSKIEAGRLRLERIEANLHDLVHESMELLAERASEKGLKFFGWIDPDVPDLVICDPTRIRQILVNLCSNAVKFTDEGEVVVRVFCESQTHAAAVVRISIRDTGIGIDPATRSRLFEAFEQGDSSTSRKFGGTGLGLSICKRLVGMMNGQIGVQSNPGKGSEFWVTLPVVRVSASPDEKSHAFAESNVAAMPDLSALRVLVVDNSSFSGYLRHYLEQWNANCRCAQTGAEALEILRTDAMKGNPFDLVLLDYRMPDMDGLRIAEDIRTDPSIAPVRIVMLTTFEVGLDRNRLNNLGISDVLSQPLKLPILARILAQCEKPVKAQDPMKSLSFDFHADLEPTQPAEYPMRLLLVDDSEVNREVAFLMLKAMGHTIETASNGAEALQILARKTFDCVIMDCQMPIMDGYSATRQIRAVDSSVLDHDIHIIAMTANAMDGDREKCLRSGMNDYVPKPIDEIDLQRALRHCEERLIEKNCGSDRDMRQSLSTWDSQIASPTASFFPQTQAPENAAASLSTNETIRLKWNPEPKVREDAFENPMDWAIPKRLVELFISETTNRLNDLEGALDTGDTDCVARIAHTIKGTAGNFQALELFETVKSLECLAATGQLQDARALLSSARNAFALVCTRLDPQKETHAVAIPAEIL